MWVCRVATPEGLTGPKWCFSLYPMEGHKEAMKDEFIHMEQTRVCSMWMNSSFMASLCPSIG